MTVTAALLALGLSVFGSAAELSANDGTITVNGATVTAAISTPGVPATFTFSGDAGEVVTASASHGNFSDCAVDLEILDPSDAIIASTTCVGARGFLGETTLPAAGLYTLKLDPTSEDTGHVVLALSANEADAPITANGAPVTFHSDHPGQGRDYVFTATAGEVVTVTASGGTFGNDCSVHMSIVSAYGGTVTDPVCAGGYGFIGETALPGSGTYVLDMVPTGVDPRTDASTGQVVLHLSHDRADASIVANGAPVTFTTRHTGQGQKFIFSGTEGEVVTLTATGGTFPATCTVDVAIVSSFDTNVADPVCAGQRGFIGETPLPGTGTYAVVVRALGDRHATETGSVVLSLSHNNADAPIVANGAPVVFKSTHPGQGQDFIFTGTGGQVVTVSASAGTFGGGCAVAMSILSSSGTPLTDTYCASRHAFIGETRLPGDGTYTIDIVPTKNNPGATGRVTIALSHNKRDVPIVPNGAPATFTAAHPGQGQNFVFTGVQGQSVTATASGGTFADANDVGMEVLSSSGLRLASGCCIGQGVTTLGAILPGTGTYRLHIRPAEPADGTHVGSVTLTLTSALPGRVG